MNTVTRAIELIGLTKLANSLGFYPSAVQKWRDEGRLPRTELAGLTNYAVTIAKLSAETATPVTAKQLIADSRKEWHKHLGTEAPRKTG